MFDVRHYLVTLSDGTRLHRIITGTLQEATRLIQSDFGRSGFLLELPPEEQCAAMEIAALERIWRNS